MQASLTYELATGSRLRIEHTRPSRNDETKLEESAPLMLQATGALVRTAESLDHFGRFAASSDFGTAARSIVGLIERRLQRRVMREELKNDDTWVEVRLTRP